MNAQQVIRRRSPAPRTVLAVSSLGVFMAFVDATIVNIAFPDIATSFPETDISSLSWVLNAYNIVFAAFLVAAGRLADLLGRRRIFLAGLVVFTLSSVLCAVAPSANALTAFRVVQAIGAALMVPSSLGLVLDVFPADRRAHAVALLSAVGALAAGTGPSLGGLLVSVDSWRLVFLVNLPVGIVAYFLSRRHLVESRAPGRRQVPDLPGALLFGLGIAALVLAVVKGDEWGWASARFFGCLLVAAAVIAVFVQRCTWHRSPIVDLSLLRIRTFSVTNSMTVLAAAGFYGYTLANVLFLTGVWQYSVLEAGLAITPGPFVAAAVAGPTSRLAERIGHRPVLVAGGLIWGAAVFWFVERVGVRPAYVEDWLPGMILLGIGAGTLFPNLSGAAVASAPGKSFATATGLNSVARQVGAALGVAIVVAIIGKPTGLAEAANAFDDAWTFSALSLLCAGLGCVAVARLGAGDDVTETPSLGTAARVVLAERGQAASEVAESSRPLTRVPVDGDRPLVARPESTADFLAGVPLFESLAQPLRDSLADRAVDTRLAAGEWLFREGDEADSLYIVRAGRLEVVAEKPEERVLRVLGRGAALGELALLTSSRRSASVRAGRASDLIAIERAEFDRLLAEGPELALALTRAIGAQLQDSQGAPERSRAVPVTIALVVLDQGPPLTELADSLTEALGRWGRAAKLDGSEVADPTADRDPAAIYAPLLDRAEQSEDQLVLEAGSLPSTDPWTRFCLQHADRILVFASTGLAPESELPPELRRCDLVAWDVAEGSGTLGAWAERLDPIETHVLRPATSEKDVERMARRLAGHSLGIVLSGGGARAFAHIGVLEELEAAGVTIDRVAGVSMGAFIGGMFAMGMGGEEMDARCYDEWVRRRPLGDYTLPRRSLIRGERARAMLRRTFDEVAIEELPRSFMSGAAELRSAELVVSRWGPLWEAVGMSVCIPILAPPEIRGRQILVDGSLVDNLPIATMAALGEGPIIAVDVKASFERPAGDGAKHKEPPAESAPRVPSLGETLTRVLLLGSASTSESARRHASLTIKPRNDGVGLLEFHQLDAAREAGRVAAREALEQAPESLFVG